MSERSKKLAHYIRRARERQSTTSQDNQDELLDKGFAFLKIDIEREFHNQISDVNHEPGCIGTFGCAFSDKGSRVFKIVDQDGGLAIDFNPDERTAEIKGKKPINFYYFIQVKLAKDETKWCYVGGENIAELAPISCKLDTVVEEALFALFGIET
ncbi:MAG: hypothetical protein WBB89_06440 [Candidatus Acidiferrum sp.]